MSTIQPKSGPSSQSGFDAAVQQREHDHLNRWSFAHEIYGIATTGPIDWSVRIGVYGEWGTGKTTVLNFVQGMAETEGHVVVRFNPWQFSSTEQLWKEFVAAIFLGLERALGVQQPGSLIRKVKGAFGTASDTVPKIISLWKKELGSVVDYGLSYVKRWFQFGSNDLTQIREILGSRRILVLIDDLDRTDPKLIPEMLFALKEIMDVPGMAFVCAFDPGIVGRVLGRFHSGFGDDGLEFLEKIIDYPRWLPKASVEELVDLANADASQYCPYVPNDALSEAALLLPKNPRAIRQFIRLLALLRPQIERHNQDELNWPVLLAANVVKIRFPRIAPEFLGNEKFWRMLYTESLMADRGREDKAKALVDAELANLLGKDFEKAAKEDLSKCLLSIAEKFSPWQGVDHRALMYQFTLGERPCAVTWKEFGEFVQVITEGGVTREKVAHWIAEHTGRVSQAEDQVFVELLEAATQARRLAMGRASSALEHSEMHVHAERASLLLELLGILSLEMADIETDKPRINEDHLTAFFDSISEFFGSRRIEEFQSAHKAEEELLTKLCSRWGLEILPLVKAVGLGDWEGHHDTCGPQWMQLVERLRMIIKQKLALWIIYNFRHDANFIGKIRRQEYHHGVREMFLDKGSALWNEGKSEMRAVLQAASSEEIVRKNAFQTLQWLDYLLRNQDQQRADELISEPEVGLAFWNAVVVSHLNVWAVGSLICVFNRMKEHDLSPNEPDWWTQIVKDFGNASTKAHQIIHSDSAVLDDGAAKGNTESQEGLPK